MNQRTRFFNLVVKPAERLAKHSLSLSPRLCLSWLAILALLWQTAVVPVANAAALTRPATPPQPVADSVPDSRPESEAAPVAQSGSPLLVYGPRQFNRLPGPPRSVTEQFAVSGTLLSAYTLSVQNGATDGSGHVTGATILLNGAVVISSSDLNSGVSSLDHTVSLLATNLLSVRIVGPPRSFLTITVSVKPRITSLTPTMARVGESVVIGGDGFDPRTPNRNAVNFTRIGTGLTLAQVTAVSSTQLTVIVPTDAATGPITVQHEGGFASSPFNFQVSPSAPILADFNPKRGPIGTVVTLTGRDLKSGTDNPTVTFTGSSNTRVPASVSSATSTQVSVTVPNGAITGPIQLTNALGSLTTTAVFSVETPLDYTLALAPATKTGLQGGTATYVASLTSNLPSFTQLATLSVTGLPTGITASFDPQQITAGASSTLTLVIPGNISTGSYNFTVQAAALLNGSQQTRTAGGSLTVQIVSQTTLAGLVLSTKKEPIMGATVSLDGQSVTTDASGSFLLSGIAAGVDRPLMIDGRTASAPNRTYPVITEPATIIAGQANVVPFTFYLPAIDTSHEMTVVPNQTTNITTPMAPGLMLTIPAGANLTNRDGTPVTRASLTMVDIDRTPAPLPSGVGTNMVYSAQPGGARPSPGVAMPMTYPNLAGARPGTVVDLYAFDHDTAKWYIYGQGTVSLDASMIVSNAGVGLRDFSWHFPNVAPDGNPSCPIPPPIPLSTDHNSCEDVSCGDHPVDYSTGVKVEKAFDISIGGARGGLKLGRIHTSDMAGSCDACPFGRGTTHNYDMRVYSDPPIPLVGGEIYSLHVALPGEITGRLFYYDFKGTDADGARTYVHKFGGVTRLLLDRIRRFPNGTYEYRFKGGELAYFNTAGRLIKIVDPNGNTTTLDYTGSNLTRITDATGRSLTLEYSGTSIIRATDPLNRVWRYDYDGAGRLQTVTDPMGFTVRYEYDRLSRLASVTDKRGTVIKKIKYGEDPASSGFGRVIEQQFADGGIERYQYLLSGNLVTAAIITDPLGRVETKRFNGNGYIIEMVDTLGQTTKIERDVLTNLPTKISGPCGCVESTREYDNRPNLRVLTDRLGNQTKWEYDPTYNKVTKITDKLGRVSFIGIDPNNGNQISYTNALGQVTTYGYDQFGQMTSMTDALGHTSRMEYDARGNVTARVDALGHRTTMEYDIVGRLTAINDPLGRRSTMTYDALNRMVTITDAANATTTYEYDANGNRTKLTDALAHSWASTYDTKNRLVSRTDPLNRVSRMRYDTDDEMIAAISPSGRTISYGYDLRGLRTTMKDGLGNSVRFTYDNRRNMTALSDQRNNTTTFSYDELFRVIARRDPLGYATTYEYDAEGNVIATTDRLGRRTIVNYDALNRRQQVSYIDAVVNYTYDPAGRLTNIADTQGGPITWAYDEANRMLSETTPQGVVSYTYNNANQRASMTAADRPAVTYAYDTAGRLRTITQGTEVFTYTYDTLSRMMRLDRPNAVKTEYQYDQVNRLARLTHSNALNMALEDFQYSYNADDEIDSIQSLASATLLPTTKTVSNADAANRTSQFGQAVLSFNKEGQTVTKTGSGGTTFYEWDARGRLRKVILPNSQEVSYGYDALERRISRQDNLAATIFAYDGLDVVLDRTGTSSVDYLNGFGIDNKLRLTNTSFGAVYFLRDHLGSTAALVDGAGNLIERSQYEAFGANAGSSLTRYNFTSRELDASVGYTYYRARWADTQQGRFISEDPIGFVGGINLYAYADDNSINFRDPLGLDSYFGSDYYPTPPYWPPATVTPTSTGGPSPGTSTPTSTGEPPPGTSTPTSPPRTPRRPPERDCEHERDFCKDFGTTGACNCLALASARYTGGYGAVGVGAACTYELNQQCESDYKACKKYPYYWPFYPFTPTGGISLKP